MNGLFWGVYGLIKEDWKLYGINLLGFGINYTFMIVFTYYRVNKHFTKFISISLLNSVILGAIFYVFYSFVELSITGAIAFVFNLSMAISPT